MNSNLTDITLVVDRSGSMAEVREDAEGGVNTFAMGHRRSPQAGPGARRSAYTDILMAPAAAVKRS